MIDPEAAVELRHGSDDQWTEGVAQDIYRDNEGGELNVGGFKFGHDFRNARGKHGRGQGAAIVRYLKLVWVGRAYVRNVMEEMMVTMPILTPVDQLVGFSGSSGPVQSTIFGSTGS